MLKLTPAFKDYLWGGTKLKEEYGKKSELSIVAESWELSTHKDGQSIIATGEYEGKTLAQYIKEKGKAVLGTKCSTEDELPILIKLIDARDKLSIQVHPDDAYAIKHEGDLGKTEMWYIVSCEEGSELIYGFKDKLSKEEFEKRIQENTLLEVANRIQVKKGDVFFIAPGTMHAIGAGIVIAEIQESSNVTYRISDYGRLGADGKPRPLHIEKSKEVTLLDQPVKPRAKYAFKVYEGYKKVLLAECDYFKTEFIEIEQEVKLTATKESFHALLLLEGEVTMGSGEHQMQVNKGETVFIPADEGEYTIKGQGQLILTTL